MSAQLSVLGNCNAYTDVVLPPRSFVQWQFDRIYGGRIHHSSV